MNDYLERMRTMIHRSGEIAMSFINKESYSLKPDTSVVTEADKAISRFIHENLKDILKQPGHFLLDEEDESSASLWDAKRLADAQYLWAIDPIDGTRAYSNRMPLFGISIGLLRDLRPWLGMVYFPMSQELFYCDGTRGYFVEKAFSSQESQQEIQPVDQIITKQSLFLSSEALFKRFDWDFSFCPIIMPACAVIDLCWPAVGRGCGAFFKSNLWDFAGAWPISRSAGLELRSMETGKVLDKVERELFVGKGSNAWKLKEFYILASERNFPLIREGITLRK